MPWPQGWDTRSYWAKINGKGSPSFMIERVPGTHKGQSEPGLPKEELTHSPMVNKLKRLIINKKGQINGDLAYRTAGCCNVLYLSTCIVFHQLCLPLQALLAS